MKIDKTIFHQTCLDYASGSYTKSTEDTYVDYISTFSSYLVMRMKINLRNREDYIQDVLEYLLSTKIHERVDAKKNAFNLYWTSISRRIWYLQKREKKVRQTIPMSNIIVGRGAYTDEDKGDNLMLKSMGFQLEDYVIEENSFGTDINISKVVAGPAAAQSTRGRSKVKYWKDMYESLRKKKTMTEAELVRLIPLEKRKLLKDPSKSVLQNIRLLANKDGYKVSVSDTGVNKVFMIIGG